MIHKRTCFLSVNWYAD